MPIHVLQPAKLLKIMNYTLGFAAFFQKRIMNYDLFRKFAAKY